MSFAKGSTPTSRRLGGANPWLTDERRDRVEWVFATVAITSLALSPIYGFVPTTMFMVATAGVVATRPAAAARDLLVFWPLLVLPMFALISTLWSDAPERTIRAGLQLTATVATAVILCGRIDPRSMIIIGFFAFAISCAVIIPNAITVGYMAALYNLFGSKNAFTAYAVVLLGFSIAISLDVKINSPLRVFSFITIFVCAFAIYFANSAGGKASAIIFVIVFSSLRIITKLSLSWRWGLLALLCLVLIFSPIFSSEIETGLAQLRQSVLERDATLTGRTYLWRVADGLVAQRPLLGHGYYAFWRAGNIDAEGLWRHFGIISRTGFNFHGALVDMRVDLGVVGFVLTIATALGILGVSGLKMLRQPTVSLALFLAMTLVLFIRSFAETGIIAPFYPLTLIWVGAVVYAADAYSEETEPPTSGGPQGRAVPKRVRRAASALAPRDR